MAYNKAIKSGHKTAGLVRLAQSIASYFVPFMAALYFREIMINSKDNPLEWSQLMSELEDAHEHLGDLIKEMQESGKIDVESYAVDVAHVYAHLNRAWNSRESEGELSEKQWEEYRSYPKDLEPIA